jgi:hypothetical protein
MRPGADVRRHLIVTGVFIAIMGLAVAYGWWKSSRPTPLQDCVSRCAAVHREGRLVYDGPDTPKSGYKDVNSVCRCEPP